MDDFRNIAPTAGNREDGWSITTLPRIRRLRRFGRVDHIWSVWVVSAEAALLKEEDSPAGGPLRQRVYSFFFSTVVVCWDDVEVWTELSGVAAGAGTTSLVSELVVEVCSEVLVAAGGGLATAAGGTC